MVEHINKVPVIRRKTHWVWLENYQGRLWVHCDVTKWNKTTKIQMDQDWAHLMDMLATDLFVLHNPKTNTPKTKFIKHYGFSFLKEIVDKNGDVRHIWFRRK
jgi:hypothetical protein